LEGFLDAVNHADGITYRIIADYGSYEALFASLSSEPEGTALICPSDAFTLRCLTECGVTARNGSRIGIMGFDRFPMFNTILPKLSGVAYSTQNIGEQAARLLFEEKAADEAILSLICRLKTGALIKAACVIGCLLAGAEPEQISAAKEYAEAVGIAFQMVDDILDETGSAEKLGKPVHSDKENDKSTFVSLLGTEECKRRVVALTEEAKASLTVFGDKAKDLSDLADHLCIRDY